MLTQQLAPNLRRLRRERDPSQAQLAALSGLTQQYLSDLERGLRPTKVAHLDQLARALGVDSAELLGLTAVGS